MCLARTKRNSWAVKSIICSASLPSGRCEHQSLTFSRIFLGNTILNNTFRDEDIDVYELRESMDAIVSRINGGIDDDDKGWTTYGWYKPVLTDLRRTGDGNTSTAAQAVVNEVKVDIVDIRPTNTSEDELQDSMYHLDNRVTVHAEFNADSVARLAERTHAEAVVRQAREEQSGSGLKQNNAIPTTTNATSRSTHVESTA